MPQAQGDTPKASGVTPSLAGSLFARSLSNASIGTTPSHLLAGKTAGGAAAVAGGAAVVAGGAAVVAGGVAAVAGGAAAVAGGVAVVAGGAAVVAGGVAVVAGGAAVVAGGAAVVPMKAMPLSEDVLPLGDFKTHASRVLRQLKDSQRPVVITQNGRPAAVLITPEEFDRMQERETFLLAVHEGLDDANAGRLVEDQEVERILEEEFGLLESA
jgi:prevent-host-death family protein